MAGTTEFCCVNCGVGLPAVDAVCNRCDLLLAEPSKPGIYRCPVCHDRFNHPAQGLWPPKARWYLPQQQVPRCPHCTSFLHDKKSAPPPSRMQQLLLVLLVSAQFLPRHPAIFTTVLVISIGLLLADLVNWRKRSGTIISEEERYAVRQAQP